MYFTYLGPAAGDCSLPKWKDLRAFLPLRPAKMSIFRYDVGTLMVPMCGWQRHYSSGMPPNRGNLLSDGVMVAD